MTVNELSLTDFRIFKSCDISFDSGTNVITGNNAQGKTTLLEGIFYLAAARSFRTRSDRELVSFGADRAEIRAEISSFGRIHKYEAILPGAGRKQIKVNSVRLKTVGELTGRISAVVFCPDDLHMIREGAAARRRLMDMCICQLRPKYAAALLRYNRAYEQKTRILRDHREKPSLLEALDDYNDELCRLSSELIYYRSHFVRRLSAASAAVHRDFSGGSEELSLNYKTVKTVTDPFLKPSELYPQLCEHQKSHRAAEIESGLCLSGAHKDDIDILINGVPAKTFASQGQTRTAALSVKLAERQIHFEENGEYPVLLLDDVLSELDASRQSFILNRIDRGQVFITCCEDDNIASRTGGRLIRVAEGKIS